MSAFCKLSRCIGFRMKSALCSGALLVLLWVGVGSGAHAQLPDIGGGGGGIDLPSIGGGGGIDVPLDPNSIEERVPPALRDAAPELLTPRPTDPVVLDHGAALRAVRERRAIPLNDLVKAVA